jgi:ribosomal protein S3
MPEPQGVHESERKMYVKELKERVEHDAYVVDAHRVAEAMLRRAAARRADAPSITRRGARDRAAATPNRRPQG